MKKLAAVAVWLLASITPCLAADSPDRLRTALEESRTSGKGLDFYVNGQAIPGVVVSVDGDHVVARSQAQGTIVIRLDRIDGVAGFIGQPGAEKKSQ